MEYDEAFLNSIPRFLRRLDEPGSAEHPVRAARAPAPIAARPAAMPRHAAAPGPSVAACASPVPGPLPRPSASQANGADARSEEDAAFQVILPRSVIRQIRLLAAEEETTQRAVVLRALRRAGLAVPKGADVDRRAVAARRRQTA